MPAAEQKPADPQDTHKIVGGCCGLFCLASAPADLSVAIGIAPRVSLLQPPLKAATVGHQPDRIDRPPISLASL